MSYPYGGGGYPGQGQPGYPGGQGYPQPGGGYPQQGYGAPPASVCNLTLTYYLCPHQTV